MAIANTVIQLKKSGVSGNVPVTLNVGETAINYADGKLYYKNVLGSISYITNQQTFATINANSSLILATTPTDTLSIVGTNGISIIANTVSKTITIDSSIDLTLANGKTQTYYQNTAPTSPNPNDLWLANTGVLYENFGNTSYPVWAEVGPTGVMANTQPGTISGTAIYDNGVELLSFANAAYSVSNTASANTIYLAGIETTQNTWISSNAAFAQAAYTQANNALANTGSPITVNGASQVFVSNTAAATSNTTGALTVAGGLGVKGNLYSGTVVSNTVSIPAAAGYVNTNIANNNYLSFNNNNGQIFSDGNFHIHSGSGSIWINTLDSSPIRIGNQYNSGNGGGIIVTGGTYLNNVTISGTITSNSPMIMVAGLTSNNTSPVGSNWTLPLVAQYDPNSWWKPSSNTAIPSIAGWYEVYGQVWWGAGSGTGQVNVQIQKNGNTASINQANVTATLSGLVQTVSCLMYCNGTTDSIALTSYAGGSSSETVQPGGINSGLSSGTYLNITMVR